MVLNRFRNIPSPAEPVLNLRVLAEEAEARVGHLSVTPVPVDHTVPTAGYIVQDGSAGFVYSGDTGPTGRLWQVARRMKGLRALIVETAFPNRLATLAKAAPIYRCGSTYSQTPCPGGSSGR